MLHLTKYGTDSKFAVVQQDVGNGGRTGRPVDTVDTAAPVPNPTSNERQTTLEIVDFIEP
jgi:hypothetical protein